MVDVVDEVDEVLLCRATKNISVKIPLQKKKCPIYRALHQKELAERVADMVLKIIEQMFRD